MLSALWTVNSVSGTPGGLLSFKIANYMVNGQQSMMFECDKQNDVVFELSVHMGKV